MTGAQRVRAFQVACTYIGTVVGAGFASGREIYQFYGRFGFWGVLAILASVAFFSWIGYRMMALGASLQAQSFRDVAIHLFGRWLGGAVNLILLLMLFGVSATMMAGTGELARESLGLPFAVGVWVTLAVTFLTLLRGMSGVMRANSVIVPVLIAVILTTAIRSACVPNGIHRALEAGFLLSTPKPLTAGMYAVLYVAFNTGLAAGVLIPLGSKVQERRVLQAGARSGAAALGFMLVAVTFMLLAHHPQAVRYAVPMGFIASQYGGLLQWLFSFILWGEIYSTLVGNVYAIGSQIPIPRRWTRSDWVQDLYHLVLLLLAAALSSVGFTRMVAFGYTLFGWVSLLLLLALMWPHRFCPNDCQNL
ncbi:YkvI family membrane protein [Alicyclobacillus kakegawensis]|uniref:YkvI family membrane protein n=1 Tax=Alicyclobacillus kakegawensis TaxID=392012 RepID=UPI00082B3183|nr:hypothetical protein [Alicyclobacillus kakegawensis]